MRRAMCCSACAGSPCRARSTDVSFDLHGGEVLGSGGIAGIGNERGAARLAGQYPHLTGEIVLQGEVDPARLGHRGDPPRIAYVPADRQGEGLFASMSVRENAGLLPPRGWPRPWAGCRTGRSTRRCARWCGRFQIRAASLAAPVRQSLRR